MRAEFRGHHTYLLTPASGEGVGPSEVLVVACNAAGKGGKIGSPGDYQFSAFFRFHHVENQLVSVKKSKPL
jgi:hypothetical protein